MTDRVFPGGVCAAALAGLILTTAAPAAAETLDTLDIEAGVGASTNPFLRIPSRSSAFGRLSLTGVHDITSERGETTLRGYVENTTYLRDYGSKQIFDLGATTSQAVSPTVRLYGNIDFSGDFAGQLSNRLVGVPSAPPPIDLGNPLPPTSLVPDLLGITGRTYRLGGQVGASIRSGVRGTISLSAGAQRNWFSGGGDLPAYNTYTADGGYSQQVSERTSAGASLAVQRQDYSGSDYTNIVNPAVTASTQLNERLSANGSVGIMFLNQHVGGNSRNSVSPSFSGSICDRGTVSNLCASVSRDAQSSMGAALVGGGGVATITTAFGLNYFRRLGLRDTLQASISASRYSTTGSPIAADVRSSFVSGVVGYDRRFGTRMSAGVSVGGRKLFQVGADPKPDINGSVYLRYHIGRPL